MSRHRCIPPLRYTSPCARPRFRVRSFTHPPGETGDRTMATFPAGRDGGGAALVGRDRERALLREQFAAARAGRGGLVLIGGEAGIGKTTLVDSFCREAADQGALVLVGRCYDLAETP